jgi:hypothetical protein
MCSSSSLQFAQKAGSLINMGAEILSHGLPDIG